MTPSTSLPAVPVSPALIAAVFDCLAYVPMCERLAPDLLIRTARALGCSDREMPALVIRVRAAALVFADPRWDHWLLVLRAGDADMRRANDAAHRGASAGETGAWMRFRNALCEKGFSFEYSATFGQAVKGNSTLTALYGRCILFDYSYKFFYADGYGKDYQILNLDTATQNSHLDTYLVACALAFYQQQRLYRDHYPVFRPFNIAKPLWIFVGSKVTASLATSDASDIVQIVQFLHRLLANRRLRWTCR